MLPEEKKSLFNADDSYHLFQSGRNPSRTPNRNRLVAKRLHSPSAPPIWNARCLRRACTSEYVRTCLGRDTTLSDIPAASRHALPKLSLAGNEAGVLAGWSELVREVRYMLSPSPHTSTRTCAISAYQKHESLSHRRGRLLGN